jgi:hypothetical protein
VKAVGKSDKVVETCIVSFEMPDREKESFCVILFARFDGGDLEGGSAFLSLGGNIGVRCWNTPFGFGRSADEVER